MIDIDEYLVLLDEDGEDQEEKDHEKYQRELFKEYVLRKQDNPERRKQLLSLYEAGEPLTGPKGLRKQLAAFDLGYFGRAYLRHYFVRPSPKFHEELDGIWNKGVLKSRDPYQAAAEISRLDGSKSVVAEPHGDMPNPRTLPLKIRSTRRYTDTSTTSSSCRTAPTRLKVF